MAELALEQVLLARHGKTEWNRIGRRQGRLDSPLTAEGLAETGRHVMVIVALPSMLCARVLSAGRQRRQRSLPKR